MDINEFITKTDQIVKFKNKHFTNEYLDYVSKHFSMLSKNDIGLNNKFKDNLLSLLSNKNALKYACKQDISSIVKYFITNGHSTEGLMELCVKYNSLDTIRVLKTYKQNNFMKINQDNMYNIQSFLGDNIPHVDKHIKTETDQIKFLHVNDTYKFLVNEEYREQVMKSVNYNKNRLIFNLSFNSTQTNGMFMHKIYKHEVMKYLDSDKIVYDLVLDHLNTDRYLNDEEYRDEIYEFLNGNKRQLSLYIDDYDTDMDLNLIDGVKSLTIYDAGQLHDEDASALGDIYELKLLGCHHVSDASEFSEVHTLSLTGSSVTDVSMLGNVTNLDISNCQITDVSALGDVHTLNLSECFRYEDLGNFPKTSTGITDVSMLGNVHTLNLSECSGITDVSALGHVHTLNLSGCTGITDVSMLCGVTNLYISRCTGLTDISMLNNIKNLIMYNYQYHRYN